MTLSLCIDIGMYLGSIVENENQNQNVVWKVGSKPKNKYANFQHPVLAGSGKIEF